MKHITYTLTATATTTHKTPQVQQLVTALLSAFSASQEFTLENTNVLCDHGLKTKQDPTRIFAYYQNELIAIGAIAKHVTVTEPEKKSASRVAQIRELATTIANTNAISDEVRAAANAILELTK